MEVVKFCAAMSAQAFSTEFLVDHGMVPRSAFASGKDDHSSRATGKFLRHLDAEPKLVLRAISQAGHGSFVPPTWSLRTLSAKRNPGGLVIVTKARRDQEIIKLSTYFRHTSYTVSISV
jgi:hypothetical protein